MKKAIFYTLLFLFSSQISFAQTPELVKDIFPNGNDSEPNSYFVKNGMLYFMANDGTIGGEIWKTDGTENGTILVADVQADSTDLLEFYFPSRPVGIGDEDLYFVSQTRSSDRIHRVHLWNLDINDNLTLLKSMNGNPPFQGSRATDINNLTVYQDKLYFTLSDQEIWESDGTVNGTKVFFETGTQAGVSDLQIINDEFYFFIDSFFQERFTWNRNLYITDGTLSGTQFKKQFLLGCPNNRIDLSIQDEKIIGIFDNNTCGYQTYLEADGFPRIVQSNTPSTGRGINSAFYKDEDLIFFSSELFNGTQFRYHLNRVKKGTSDVEIIKEMQGINIFPLPDGRFLFDQRVYIGYGKSNYSIGATDGTAQGTSFLIGFDYLFPKFLTFSDGYIFAASKDGILSFWYSDGTEVGTQKITDFASSQDEEETIDNFFIDDQTIYFSGNDGTIGFELWKIELPNSLNISDLALNANQAKTFLLAGDTSEVTFNLTNRGGSEFSNIEVDLNIPAAAQLLENNEYTATQGTLLNLDTQSPTWQIGILESGESAILTLNIIGKEFLKIPIYGQVQSADGNDSNSTPGNGTCCETNEDDEAVVLLNPQIEFYNRPDFFCKEVIPYEEVARQDSLTVNFLVDNLGYATIDSTVKVQFILSDDWGLSADDQLIGEDLISNLKARSYDNLFTRKVRIPESSKLGTNYLHVSIDPGNNFSEILESNNQEVESFHIYSLDSLPDLVPSIVSIPSSGIQSELYDAKLQIINNGKTEAIRAKSALVFSTDPFYDPDKEGSSGTLSRTVGAGETVEGEINLVVHHQRPPGLYYLLNIADKDSLIREEDEGNNFLIAGTFKVLPEDSDFPFVDLNLNYENFGTVINPNLGDTFSTKLILKNRGSGIATNLEVSIPEVIGASEENLIFSDGLFNMDDNRLWIIDTLEAGQTAFIETFYTRKESFLFEFCAEVWDCDQPSPDVLYADGACKATADASFIIVAPAQTSSTNDIDKFSDGFLLQKVNPNPFSNQLNLEILSNKNEETTIQFFDILGKEIHQQAVFLKSGINQLEVDGSDLSKGLIFVKVGNQVEKIIKG